MNGRVAQIWRYPIKAHGCEALQQVELSKGQTMPWDRHWAVAHEHSEADGREWVPCANFSRGAKAPSLMALKARLDERTQRITLTHPDLQPLSFLPDGDETGFLEWIRKIMPETRAASARIIRVPGRGLTDTAFPSISLNSLTTLDALSSAAGHTLSPLRWRGNIWFEGLPAWQEFDWIGKRLRIGTAELVVRERITRCRATMANPENGICDTDTLALIEKNWGHKDFGIYGEIITDGCVSVGDKLEVLQ